MRHSYTANKALYKLSSLATNHHISRLIFLSYLPLVVQSPFLENILKQWQAVLFRVAAHQFRVRTAYHGERCPLYLGKKVKSAGREFLAHVPSNLSMPISIFAKGGKPTSSAAK